MKHQKTIEQDVIKYIKRHNLLLDAKKIIVALSGGADSVFALHFFYKYRNKYKTEISAVHVNHNLRGTESDKDEKFSRLSPLQKAQTDGRVTSQEIGQQVMF